MSLDRQRILSELGSVMNQLKSADCGCMGKLFSNQNQNQGASMGSPMQSYGGCRRGCCHGHGYNMGTPCAGEPYSMNHSMNRPCMGHCNPPKLYADTYNYLNNNLMQPVVKEVYDDLKSINPGNAVMNSPLANQMGLSQGSSGATMQGDVSGGFTGAHNMPGMGNTNPNTMAMEQSRQPMNAMGGMGPQIMNMIMGDGSSKPSNAQGMQGGQLKGPTVIDAPQSPHGQVGITPINTSLETHQFRGNLGNSFNQQGNNGAGYGQNPTTQYMTQLPNQGNPMMGNMGQNATPQGSSQMGMVSGSPQMGTANPGAQQIAPAAGQYGQHTQGVMKFNEMFPGVMQGGDLGFDPMAIAIQMNPANQQKAAMDTMQKMMTSGPMSRAMDPSVMKPVMDATKTAVQNINPSNTVPVDQNQQNVSYVNQTGGQQILSGQQNNINPLQNTNQQFVPGNQQAINQNTGIVSQPLQQQQQQQLPYQQQQEQVYTAVTGAVPPNQQQLQQQQLQGYQQQLNPNQQYQQPQTQYITDPNTGAAMTPPTMPGGYNEGMTDPNGQMQPSPPEQADPQGAVPPQPMYKDPIFPADTSRNRPFIYSKPVKHLDYNTLGQPIEMLPAKMFHPPEPGLPQTLSPQPATKLRNDYMRYSNVKSTISKTSLMGNKPVGRTPSRSQLQHIYNQYKGSQSFTQQNVRPPVQGGRPPVQGGTFSEGKLNIPPTNNNPPQPVVVEKVGGDTAANNQLASHQITNKAQPMGYNNMGDVPVPTNKPQGDAPIKPSSPIPTRQAKLRNGLQDVVYTSYPSSAAWSFHGTNTYRPIASVGYRFRNIR
ncbi:transcription factor SPT20 homolog [Ostrinia furnacalis]|uniref:transcription factor SPT20 homolog n=1 Tax=Ostrinia furnacalis TaxID=93504 RepID=UPI0010394B8B|nr:transcription factor SPT20 homolog [Ostrinia furnacalis]